MPLLGEFAALFTAFLWSVSALVFASATRRAGSFQVNITRLILASVYLVLLILAFGLDVDLSTSQLVNLAISGFIGLTIGDTFLFKAFQEIGPRISMLIMSAAPAIAAVLAYWMLGESLSSTGVLGIAITLAGISIVLLDRRDGGSSDYHISISGVVYAALGAAGQGVGLIYAKMAFQEGVINGFVASAIRIVVSLIFLLPLALMTRRFVNPIRMFLNDRTAFWLTALGSIVGPFLGITFSLIAIEYTKVGIAATIMAIVPILMLPLVRYFYKETLTWRAIIGAWVAVAGVAVLFLR